MARRIKRSASSKPKGRFHHGDLADALIDEAGRMLEEHGHETLTLRSLATRLGVTQPALYRHFASKDDLLLAVARRGLVDFEQMTLAAVEAHPDDPYAALRAVGRGYVRYAHAHRGWFRYVFTRGSTEGPPPVPGSRPQDSQTRDALRETIGRIVGPEHPRLDDVYRSLWGLAHGLSWLVLERVFQLVETDAERIAAADAAFDAFVDSLEARFGHRP